MEKRHSRFFMPERVRKRGRVGKRKVFPRWMEDERRETGGRGKFAKMQMICIILRNGERGTWPSGEGAAPSAPRKGSTIEQKEEKGGREKKRAVGRAVPGEPKTEVATKNTKRTKGGR